MDIQCPRATVEDKQARGCAPFRFSWAIVQDSLDSLDLSPRDLTEPGPGRNDLAQQPVCVFVHAPHGSPQRCMSCTILGMPESTHRRHGGPRPLRREVIQ